MNSEVRVPSVIEQKVKNTNGRDYIKRYRRGKFLGKGGFAHCYELTSCDTNQLYAGKIVPKSKLNKRSARAKLLSEIKIHKAIKHRNIVKFKSWFEDKHNVYILLEFCENQTLTELVHRRKRLNEPETQCIMLQLLSAVRYLHENNIIHRDLKLGNIFLAKNLQLKVGDFGLAAKLEFHNQRKTTLCGTPNYIAPEILASGSFGHSFEVDIWSLGIIMYTLLIGKPPFETSNIKRTYKRIQATQYDFPRSPVISSQARMLIRHILHVDPKRRPSLEQIEKARFFTQSTPLKSLPLEALYAPTRISRRRQQPQQPQQLQQKQKQKPRQKQNQQKEQKQPDEDDLSQKMKSLQLFPTRPKAPAQQQSQKQPQKQPFQVVDANTDGRFARPQNRPPRIRNQQNQNQQNYQQNQNQPNQVQVIRGPTDTATATTKPTSAATAFVRQTYGMYEQKKVSPSFGGIVQKKEKENNVANVFQVPLSKPSQQQQQQQQQQQGGGIFHRAQQADKPPAAGRQKNVLSPSFVPPQRKPNNYQQLYQQQQFHQQQIQQHQLHLQRKREQHQREKQQHQREQQQRQREREQNQREQQQRQRLRGQHQLEQQQQQQPAVLPIPQNPVKQSRRRHAIFGITDTSASPSGRPRKKQNLTATPPKQQRRGRGRLGVNARDAQIIPPNENKEEDSVPMMTEERNWRRETIHLLPDIWACKWADYTDKYGLGYIFCDGSVGVVFNDRTKLILAANERNIEYIGRAANQVQRCSVDSYNPELDKKIILLKHFLKHLKKGGKRFDQSTKTKGLVYMREFQKTNCALVFEFSNETVQYNFNDHSEIIIHPSELGKMVTFTDVSKQRKTYTMEIAAHHERTDLKERMDYIDRYKKEMHERAAAAKRTPLG